ncbi:MAG: DUF3604 domain-containing protein [Pseudomonadota bacterium]
MCGYSETHSRFRGTPGLQGIIGLWIVSLLAAPLVWAEKPYSPAVGQDYPTQVFWGDTHLHTRNSADAYSLGNMYLTPADAYRFAQGQALTVHNGMEVKLRRPLDFLVVSDHAEYLGGYYRFNVGDPQITATRAGKQWSGYLEEGNPTALIAAFTASMADPENNYAFPETTRRTIWEDVAKTSDEYNQPGKFTALTGYEWTSMIAGNNLHRVVVYKDGADKVAKLPPFSGQDSLDPRDLWDALARYEKATGGEVIAIAHNGNLSNGMMFPDTSVDGEPITEEYAIQRARWEPIYEVTQVKGDGEAHPFMSPNDEFANYENWDWDNIGRNQAKEDWMLKHEYARSALQLGMAHEEKLGANPFKFGMIGSTDGHNSISTPQEDNFFGKFPESLPGQERTQNSMANNQLWQNWRIVASGYAAVWAKENTREAIFDAMKRREVYATTGSRIKVRMFGGWDFSPEDINHPAYLDIGYGQGVPMGGDLPRAEGGEERKHASPTFLVSAAKDPDGPNLDRIQMVKGWIGANGEHLEKVYDIAWAGERRIDADAGKLPAIGSTVDLRTATYDNSIGSAQLSIGWQDPDFDPKLRAFYYVRVLEIPRPRWTAYDAVHFNLKLPEEVPMVIQDRAYSSPIWYTP